MKNADFDPVTTANNHLLDMGVDGALRTIKILNDKQIDFVGSYLSDTARTEKTPTNLSARTNS